MRAHGVRACVRMSAFAVALSTLPFFAVAVLPCVCVCGACELACLMGAVQAEPLNCKEASAQVYIYRACGREIVTVRRGGSTGG